MCVIEIESLSLCLTHTLSLSLAVWNTMTVNKLIKYVLGLSLKCYTEKVFKPFASGSVVHRHATYAFKYLANSKSFKLVYKRK